MSDDYVIGGGSSDGSDPNDLVSEYINQQADAASTFERWLNSAPSTEEELPIAVPEGMGVQREGERLTISRRWFGPAIVVMTIVAVFWNGFMLIWFGIAFSQGEAIMAAFGSIHALVGLGMIYYVVAGYLNYTYIRVEPQRIAVLHEPVPWFGAKELDAQGIQQLYTKRRVSTSRSGSSHRTRTTVTYEVRIIDGAGRDSSLIKGLAEDTQALFIEQAIEKHLDIPDRLVRGEMR